MTILTIAFILTLIGYYWLRTVPTPLMIGRSMPYLIYYVIGVLINIPILTKRDSTLIKMFAFLGKNALIVFGLHDIYLTITRIGFLSMFGEMDNLLGFCNLLIVLLMMWPTIFFLNKYAPHLVAKKELLTIER